jgi:hypothetical protein
VWEHKPGRHNQVDDALSRKQVDVVVVALSWVETDFLDRIRELSKNDTTYLKLADLMKECVVRQTGWRMTYLYGKGRRLYVPTGPIQRELLRESYDS